LEGTLTMQRRRGQEKFGKKRWGGGNKERRRLSQRLTEGKRNRVTQNRDRKEDKGGSKREQTKRGRDLVPLAGSNRNKGKRMKLCLREKNRNRLRGGVSGNLSRLVGEVEKGGSSEVPTCLKIGR